MAKIIVSLDRLAEHPWAHRLLEILATDVVDAVRINTVRWSEEQIRGAIGAIRTQRPETKILLDLGQKLRVNVPEGSRVIRRGETLRVREVPDATNVSLTHDLRSHIFERGQEVLMCDGRIRGHVVERDTVFLSIEIVHVDSKNPVLDHLAGIRFPGLSMNVSAIGPREQAMLELAGALGVEMVASSFVENAADVERLCKALPRGYDPIVVAKIETSGAVDAIDEILAAFPKGRGMVMIARGDLFIEDPEHLAHDQRRTASACKRHDIPFIVATGLLRSMRWEPMPSRAEVIDADAAVRSGAAYLMLAEETAGDAAYAIETINCLRTIADLAEEEG